MVRFPSWERILRQNLIVEGRDLVREVHVRNLEPPEFLRGNSDGWFAYWWDTIETNAIVLAAIALHKQDNEDYLELE